MDVEELTLRSGDHDLPAAVFWPSGSEPRPAVVVATGGLETGSVDAYRWAGERLAADGYVALVTTYRAPAPYADAADLSAATDWLSRRPLVDGQRMAIWGHSRGGLGALIAAEQDHRLKAAISICAPSNLPDYLSRLGVYFPVARDSIQQFLGGSPEEVPGQYAAVDLLGLAGRLVKPVLLIHGTADMRIPVDQSVSLAAALEKGGNAAVRLELLRGVGHFLELGTTGYQFDRVIELTVSWLNEVMD